MPRPSAFLAPALTLNGALIVALTVAGTAAFPGWGATWTPRLLRAAVLSVAAGSLVLAGLSINAAAKGLLGVPLTVENLGWLRWALLLEVLSVIALFFLRLAHRGLASDEVPQMPVIGRGLWLCVVTLVALVGALRLAEGLNSVWLVVGAFSVAFAYSVGADWCLASTGRRGDSDAGGSIRSAAEPSRSWSPRTSGTRRH